MRPAYVVSTPKGQYLCEVFEHPSAGFVWMVNGKRVNYAIPGNMRTSKDLLQFQVAQSFGGVPIVLEAE